MTEELFAANDALEANDQVFAAADAMRLRVMVGTLATLVAEPDEFDEESALKQYDFAIRVTGLREGDNFAREFLRKAGAAFRGIAAHSPLDVTGTQLNLVRL